MEVAVTLTSLKTLVDCAPITVPRMASELSTQTWDSTSRERSPIGINHPLLRWLTRKTFFRTLRISSTISSAGTKPLSATTKTCWISAYLCPNTTKWEKKTGACSATLRPRSSSITRTCTIAKVDPRVPWEEVVVQCLELKELQQRSQVAASLRWMQTFHNTIALRSLATR